MPGTMAGFQVDCVLNKPFCSDGTAYIALDVRSGPPEYVTTKYFTIEGFLNVMAGVKQKIGEAAPGPETQKQLEEAYRYLSQTLLHWKAPLI